MIIRASLLTLLGCTTLGVAGSSDHASSDHLHSSLNFSSAGPHIFASTFGLLQQWTNTFVPYGHSIVPCEVPVNTKLYHARIIHDMPPSPEWFAFDVTMAYGIAGMLNTSRLLTYRTTKAVKCLYFDGASAALNGAGNMDTQMVLIHNDSASIPDDFGRTPNNRTSGDPHGGMLGAEYDRAEGLCAFIHDNKLGGRGWGYEGIVRMNAGFEMIWCDFDSPSAKLVSNLAVSDPSYEQMNVDEISPANVDVRLAGLASAQQLLSAPPRRGHGGPGWGTSAFSGSSILGWLQATVDQYGFAGVPGRGEVRVKADSSNLWSLYDPGLVDQEKARVDEECGRLNISSSGIWKAPVNATEREAALLALQRRRRAHRAEHVSKRDGLYMRDAVLERLHASLEPSGSSGIDWHQIAQEIVLEYGRGLRDMVELLKAAPVGLGSDHEETGKWMRPIRAAAHLFMMPFYEYPSYYDIERSPEAAFDIAAAESKIALERCRDQYSPSKVEELTTSEQLIYSAIDEVLGAVCKVTLSTFLSVESIWYASFDKPVQSFEATSLHGKVQAWREQTEELMAWLGWADQWTACEPGCGPDEVCLIPLWPVEVEHMVEMDGPGGPPDDGPPGDGPRGPGGPRRGGPGGGRRGPGFGGTNEKLLYEPQCKNLTALLIQISNNI